MKIEFRNFLQEEKESVAYAGAVWKNEQSPEAAAGIGRGCGPVL